MAFALTREERAYAQVQASYNLIPHTGGTANLDASNAFRFIRLSLDPDIAVIARQDKTGSRTNTPGVKGRSFGRWSLEASLAPNGVAGIVPDIDPLLVGLMGQAGAVTTATSGNGFPAGTTVVDGSDCIKYAFADTIVPFLLASYRQPSTIDQRIAHSCTINTATFNLGQDGGATFTMEGEASCILSKNRFAAFTALEKAGLTSFSAEPASPVTNGGMIVGFTGKALFAGSELAGLRTGSTTVTPGNVAVKDQFGAFIPTRAEGDARQVSTQFSIYEDDSAAFTALETAAYTKAPIEIVYQIGTVPGSIVVMHHKGVQIIPPAREEQRSFIANFPAAPCNGSGLTTKDELTIWVC